jgi:hypothetical protein
MMLLSGGSNADIRPHILNNLAPFLSFQLVTYNFDRFHDKSANIIYVKEEKPVTCKNILLKTEVRKERPFHSK